MTRRVCGRCRMTVVAGQPDPCWGFLPGVAFACCGHGNGTAYIRFENGVTLRPSGPEGDLDVDGVTRPPRPWDITPGPVPAHLEEPE